MNSDNHNFIPPKAPHPSDFVAKRPRGRPPLSTSKKAIRSDSDFLFRTPEAGSQSDNSNGQVIKRPRGRPPLSSYKKPITSDSDYIFKTPVAKSQSDNFHTPKRQWESPRPYDSNRGLNSDSGNYYVGTPTTPHSIYQLAKRPKGYPALSDSEKQRTYDSDNFFFRAPSAQSPSCHVAKRPRGRPALTDSIKAMRTYNASGERRRGRPMKPNNLRILQSMSKGNFDFLGPVTQNNGFKRGLTIKEIICAFNRGEDLLFLVKFKRCTELEVVSNEELKNKAPNVLIKYYEEHVDMDPDTDSDTLTE
ncbi:heterochromatin protein 1 isoform X2 [Drosophila ananassae]|uniref:heterochromatin protein 1 isoform X2 n=1 Tax=Drosophila ananassae TaxID=7217 RepID=UPI001D0001F1|nr:heterochromatin protein 1 isoform X2 [Drosophila ananassae]